MSERAVGRFVALSVVLINVTVSQSQMPPEDTFVPKAVPASADAECEALVVALRAKEPPPAAPVPDWDTRATPARIVKVTNRLVAYGTAAFPALLRHLDDREYSYSASGPQSAPFHLDNYDVGEVCSRIIHQQVDQPVLYLLRRGMDMRDHDAPRYFSRRNMTRWWEERKSRSLREIQVEIVDWYIKRERAIGFPGPRDEQLYLRPLLATRERLIREDQRGADKRDR
jgi:hypothetical protein